jgi:hypothetical protein
VDCNTLVLVPFAGVRPRIRFPRMELSTFPGLGAGISDDGVGGWISVLGRMNTGT